MPPTVAQCARTHSALRSRAPSGGLYTLVPAKSTADSPPSSARQAMYSHSTQETSLRFTQTDPDCAHYPNRPCTATGTWGSHLHLPEYYRCPAARQSHRMLVSVRVSLDRSGCSDSKLKRIGMVVRPCHTPTPDYPRQSEVHVDLPLWANVLFIIAFGVPQMRNCVSILRSLRRQLSQRVIVTPSILWLIDEPTNRGW